MHTTFTLFVKHLNSSLATHFLLALETLDIPPAILNNQEEPPGCTWAEAEFFAHLEDGTLYPPDHCSFMNDFTAVLFKLMKYDEQERQHIIHSYDKILFDMCGKKVTAKVDMCVMEQGQQRYILPIQRDQVSYMYSLHFIIFNLCIVM